MVRIAYIDNNGKPHEAIVIEEHGRRMDLLVSPDGFKRDRPYDFAFLKRAQAQKLIKKLNQTVKTMERKMENLHKESDILIEQVQDGQESIRTIANLITKAKAENNTKDEKKYSGDLKKITIEFGKISNEVLQVKTQWDKAEKSLLEARREIIQYSRFIELENRREKRLQQKSDIPPIDSVKPVAFRGEGENKRPWNVKINCYKVI